MPSLGPNGRAVGLDVHPDTFAAAIMQGRDPLKARVQHSVTRQPLDALCAWAARHTTQEDVLVIEASANTFTVSERLTAIGRQVFILESHRAGQIGKSYLATDRKDAAKIARIYLSGLAIKVWMPDPETRQRRELLSVYQRCIKESTRARLHLRSFARRSCASPAGCAAHRLSRSTRLSMSTRCAYRQAFGSAILAQSSDCSR